MSWNRPWKNALVNRRPARHTTPLRVERLEARDLPAAPVPADIVSWYRAEGDASDFVGDNAGTLVNGATFTPGMVGQAFLFDGIDDHVSIRDDSSLEPGSDFTIEAWVYPSDLGHGRPIAQKRSDGNVGGYTFETNGDTGLQFVVWIDEDEHTLQTQNGVLAIDEWHHVAATYDGAWLRIFVDGVQQAETSASGVIDPSEAGVVIGQNVVITDFAWEGAIDEISFYSRALSQEELQSIVDADSEGKELPDTYDAAGDFSITGNPNGAWSYGWSASLGGAFTKDVSTRSGHPHPELQSWDGPISSFYPVISKNTTNATVVVGTVTWLPGQMVNHPGPNGEYSVLRWTAPKAGEVEFSASFSGADSTTTDVHVLFNETTIAGCDGNVNGFGAGPAFSQTIVVEIGDTIDFVVGFGNNGYTSDSTGVDAHITYEDENPPTPDLSVTISDAPEPVLIGDPVTYTVTVTNHGPLDATGATVVALGPPGQQFNSVTIPIGDLASGAARSFQVVFTPAAVGTFSATAIVTANEDDSNPTNNSFTETTVVAPRSTIELAQAQYEVREGEKFAILTVRRTGDLLNSASVEYITVNGTAGQRGIGTGLLRIADFTTTSGELFFRSRSNVATIRVPIGDDFILEPDETFHVVLSDPSTGTGLGLISSAEVTIHDNDPTISFLDTSSERNEGVTGRGPIEVRLHPASNQTVTVAYAAAGGSAIAGTDYSLVGRSLTFRPGETRKFIQFSNVNDTLFEGNETAFIELTSATNAFLGASARHRVTIVDNDPQPPPADPGSTLATALAIDLATLPRQSYRQYIGKSDVDTFVIELGPLERLALDVDPFSLSPGLPALPSSKLTIRDHEGVVLATIGASAEPETGVRTNNAAHLFQADADGGTYYIQLTTEAPAKSYGYSLGFHRIGVSENVPSPEQLNASGAMYAWYDGVDTVGITGPTGYGFTLEGPWERQITSGKSALKSQKLTLETGDQFTLKSPQGVELPLVATGTITISTKAQRWGDVVGVVTREAIFFPVALSIVPINDLLADVFGSNFATVGLLGGEWRISLGGSVYNVFDTAFDLKEKIDQLLPGVPYIRKFGGSTVDARLGGQRLSFSETPLHWIVDPADPMLFVKVPPVPFTNFKGAALAVSMHGLLKFKPQNAPDPEIDAGVTEFAGHVYAQAKVRMVIATVPVVVDGDFVVNVDADRDGLLLGDLGDVQDVFDIVRGDFSEIREILDDIQLGVNGTAVVAVPPKKPDGEDGPSMEAGRASLVLNGPTGTVWVRGQQGGKVFPDSPIEVGGSSTVMEGLIDFDSGEFFIAMTTSNNGGGIELEYKFTVSNVGISVSITGSIGWDAKINYGAGTISGRAKATFTAEVAIEIDDDGDVHLSGSISARGRLTIKINGDTKELFDDSIDSSVRSSALRFRFPRGVGNIDWNPF